MPNNKDGIAGEPGPILKNILKNMSVENPEMELKNVFGAGIINNSEIESQPAAAVR